MAIRHEVDRDIDLIRLPVWGGVVRSDGVVPWLVVDPAGVVVEPVRRFLRDFVAGGNAGGSVRSYCFALHRWWRFLLAIDVEWDKATPAEARDFVLWLLGAEKVRRSARTVSAARVGRINPVTRKRHLDDSYQPRTVRHSNAVLRSFYGYWIELGEGPLVNPVPLARGGGGRPHAHHNPLEPFRPQGRLRYNPPVPRRRPRAMPDERWDDLFAAMRSDRDRAVLALAVSTGARVGELLGIRGGDVDWGEQVVRVRRKGSGAWQWLPASPEAFSWLRSYLGQIGEAGTDEPVWRTLRRRRGAGGLRQQPLSYDALRAVLRRANESLGANWTMHDLRHTCALRMVRDGRLSLRDVQVILGHACLATTQLYLDEDDSEVIGRVRGHLQDRRQAGQAPAVAADGYNPADLAVLFGQVQQ